MKLEYTEWRFVHMFPCRGQTHYQSSNDEAITTDKRKTKFYIQRVNVYIPDTSVQKTGSAGCLYRTLRFGARQQTVSSWL